MDNVLIYLDRSREDYEQKVKAIVQKLSKAGLHFNIGKSEFLVKKTKYLSFIIKAKKGIYIDLDKIAAIKA
jgi:chemotaxis methyl-accepting protein methylase